MTAISTMVSLFGKIFICSATCFAFYLTLDHYLINELYSPVGPTAFVLILTIFSATMFTNVFSMTINTILQCFIADEEMFGGSDACFSSNSLKSYIEKNKTNPSTIAIAP